MTDDQNRRGPPAGSGPRGQKTGGDPLATELQSLIGRRLQAHYASVLNEPIPERFSRLLDQLQAATPPDEDGQATTPGDDGSPAGAPAGS